MWLGFVGLEDLEAAELGVDEVEGLEALCFEDLLVEPGLDFVLLFFGEFLVQVVDVAVELEQRQLCTHVSIPFPFLSFLLETAPQRAADE